MARKKILRAAQERGSLLYGALSGLLIGLILAAGLAFYITKTPVPFIDHAPREEQRVHLPAVRHTGDPNLALYGPEGPAGTVPGGPNASRVVPLPDSHALQSTVTPSSNDEIGAFIAMLPKTEAPKPSGKMGSAPLAKHAKAVLSKPHLSSSNDISLSSSKEVYFLQAGAFRVSQEAELLKGRIIMLGLPAVLQQVQVNNVSLSRVRVGPFSRLDDMNHARVRLGENKIESAVVRQ